MRVQEINHKSLLLHQKLWWSIFACLHANVKIRHLCRAWIWKLWIKSSLSIGNKNDFALSSKTICSQSNLDFFQNLLILSPPTPFDHDIVLSSKLCAEWYQRPSKSWSDEGSRQKPKYMRSDIKGRWYIHYPQSQHNQTCTRQILLIMIHAAKTHNIYMYMYMKKLDQVHKCTDF